jgi:hypothetical protein
MDQNMIAIIVVVYNVSNLISTQIDFIRRFCKDDKYHIIIIDNSNNQNISNQIKQQSLSCIYHKIDSGTNGSEGHAFACNYAYSVFQNNYEYMFFLDHDIFPITNFSVKDILGDKVIGGPGQIRKTKIYLWPGCVMFNNNKIAHNLISFSTNPSLGLDTGGMLYRVIETYGQNNCAFFDEHYEDNISVNGTNYGNYSIISNPSFSFMHFRNASNWNYVSNNDERIASLLHILHNKVK